MLTSKNKKMLLAKNLMPNKTAAGPQNAQNSLNNDWRSEHELMTLQKKIATAQTARKLTQAEKNQNEPARNNMKGNEHPKNSETYG